MRTLSTPLDPRWISRADPAWLERWRPEPFDLGDGTVEVVVMGEGPPLALLPPFPGWKEAFAPAAHLLARRFRVVTFDLRTSHPDGPSWERLGADLGRITEVLAPGPLILVGHSLGGALAQRFALAHPARVRGLVLSSSFARVFTPAAGLLARWVEQPALLGALRTLPEGPADALAQWMARHERWMLDRRCGGPVAAIVSLGARTLPVATAVCCLRLAFAHDLRAELPRLGCPALVYTGGRDTAFARESARELVRLLPGAEVAVCPEAGHLHPMSRPDRFAEAISRFADGL